MSRIMPRALRATAALAALGVMLTCTGCLNPQFLNQFNASYYPTAPGDNPFVLVRLVNDTTAKIDVDVVADDGSVPPPVYSFTDLDSLSREAGVVVPWPIRRVSLGDPDQPMTASVTATFPNGLTTEIAPMQAALVAGQDFQRGDTIVYYFSADARSPAFITVSSGLIPGANQTGPFRADTFSVLQLVLLRNGLEDSDETTP